MRVLIQRCLEANCKVEGKIVGEIKKGFVVFVGFHKDDSINDLEYLFKKVSNIRIFENEEGKIHYSIQDIKGEILLIPQFTLYANTKKGNRPDFLESMPPQQAKEFFYSFVDMFKQRTSLKIETGVFGADMKIYVLNDGPFSIFIDSSQRVGK